MQSNGLFAADYVVIAAFFLVMIGVGLFFRTRVRDTGAYFGGGGRVPWWLAGISFYMCTFSALGFVVYSALAYQYGWTAVTIYWTTVPAMLIVARFLAHRWRRVAKTSPLEYIHLRYGRRMVDGLVLLGIPTRVLDGGLKLLAIGTVVAAGMGLPLAPAIIVSGVIMVSYTFFGGLWAALVADFIQFIVLLAAVLVLPFLAISAAGGVDGFLNGVPEGFFTFFDENYSWFYVGVFFLIILLNNASSWALVQRFYSTGNDTDARKVGYLVAILNFVGPPIFYLPAMAAQVFLPEIENMNEVYALVCKELLPVGMLGLVIAAMFSATMSMLAGDFNAIASVLTNDVYRRFLKPDVSSQRLMFFARVNTLLVGIVVIALAFAIREFQGAGDLFRVMVKIFGLFLPPVAIPMLAGMLSRTVSDRGGFAGMLTGISFGFVLFVLGTWIPEVRNEQVLFLVTTTATIAGMFWGTRTRPNSPERAAEVATFIDRVNDPKPPIIESSNQKSKELFSPFPIIGFGVLAIGLLLSISVMFSPTSEGSWISITVGVAMSMVGGGFVAAGRREGRTKARGV